MRSDQALRRAALAAYAVVIALVAAYVVCFQEVLGDPRLTYPESGAERSEALAIALGATVALALVWLRPRNAVGWLLGLAAMCLAVGDAGAAVGAWLVLDHDVDSGAGLIAWTAPTWIPGIAIGPTLLLARYPSGTITGRWARRLDRAAVLGFGLVHLGYATSVPAVSDVIADGRPPVVLLGIVASLLAVAGGVMVVADLGFVLCGAIVRLIRSSERERTALVLLFGAAVLLVVATFLSPFEWLLSLAWLAVMVAIAVGVLRYGALGIELSLLTGDGRDPLAALSRLGSPSGPGDVAGLLERLRQALDVDGVGLADGDVAGTLSDQPMRVPLVHGGEDVGTLLVGSKHGGRPDPRVLATVAPLLAAVLHGLRLARDLEAERIQALRATETERARLRQELHDGLGPSLTGIGLGLEALRPADRDEEMVRRIRAEVSTSLEETRRIIDDLQPTALDTADLVTAIRARAEQIRTATGTSVTVDAQEHLPALPPAVAKAALRITEEALTNVVRHARATSCSVRLTIGENLEVIVSDDGDGYRGPREGGVGLASMQERAERLGGTVTVTGSSAGTVVTASIPRDAG